MTPENYALLSLAARAIGCEDVEVVEEEEWVNLHFPDGSTTYNWNPSRHSDDMLSLLVKFSMRVSIDDGLAKAGCSEAVAEVLDKADPGAAVRLAVTKVAAEIGKAK